MPFTIVLEVERPGKESQFTAMTKRKALRGKVFYSWSTYRKAPKTWATYAGALRIRDEILKAHPDYKLRIWDTQSVHELWSHDDLMDESPKYASGVVLFTIPAWYTPEMIAEYYGTAAEGFVFATEAECRESWAKHKRDVIEHLSNL